MQKVSIRFEFFFSIIFFFYFYRITSNLFLTHATFFDPRFQNQLSTDEQNMIQSELKKMFNKNETNTSQTKNSNPSSTTKIGKQTVSNKNKTNWKQFFFFTLQDYLCYFQNGQIIVSQNLIKIVTISNIKVTYKT